MAESHLSVTGVTTKLSLCVKQTKKREKSQRKEEESDKKSKLHWWTLGLKGERREMVEGGGGERDAPSDRQRDEAVILLDVTFENV